MGRPKRSAYAFASRSETVSMQSVARHEIERENFSGEETAWLLLETLGR